MVDPGFPGRIGKYQIREQIGRGGMGLVYRGFDPALEREVAIKVIHTAKFNFAEQLTRFAAEAKALAQLCSPYVVQVFDYHPDPVEPYLVMEYVRGRSLATVMREEGPLPLRRLIDCAWQVLSGLVAAHGAGILHRDLKPGNILLAADGVYKLADFGLATGTNVAGMTEEDLTDTGEIVGTVRYLAPERAAGGDATVQTDLYALGVTLYELATGRHPVVREDNPLRTAQRIVNEPLRPFREALPAVPAEVAAWVDRLCAHAPAKRFTTASEALHALEPLDIPAGPDRRATTRRVAKGDDSRHTEMMAMPAAATPLEGTVTGITGAARLAGTNRPPSTAIAMPVSGLRPVPAALLRRPRIRFVIKLILAIWLFSSAATLVAGLAISHRAIADQMQRLRSTLASTAAGAALLIDGKEHRRLSLAGAAAEREPAFQKMIIDLRRYKQINPDITYIYTMAKRPDSDTTKVVNFVVDASEAIDRNGNGVIDADEEIAPPGKTYPAGDAPELLEGFEHPIADDEVVQDQWGSWLSGYAPIRDTQGRSVGLVGVDMSAKHIATLENDFLIHSAVLLASTLVAFLAGGVLVALRMRQPIVALQQGLLKVAQGDLDVQLDVRTGDEFRVLADTFTFMIGELRDAAAIRRAFEGFVAHSLAAQLNRQGMLPAPQSGGLAARLYCDLDQGDGPLIDRAALGRVLSQVLPLLFDAVKAHNGVPERVLGSGVLIVFPAAGSEDRPQARAVRAALAFLAAVENSGTLARVAIGIDLGEDASGVERRAVALGHLNRQMGTDLLISGGAFLPIRSGFYADRLRIDPLGQDLPVEGYAVKGAVSA